MTSSDTDELRPLWCGPRCTGWPSPWDTPTLVLAAPGRCRFCSRRPVSPAASASGDVSPQESAERYGMLPEAEDSGSVSGAASLQCYLRQWSMNRSAGLRACNATSGRGQWVGQRGCQPAMLPGAVGSRLVSGALWTELMRARNTTWRSGQWVGQRGTVTEQMWVRVCGWSNISMKSVLVDRLFGSGERREVIELRINATIKRSGCRYA